MVEDFAPRQNLVEHYRKPLLGALAVALFFAAWQAIFLVVPFNPLFISKPNLIFEGYVDLVESGDLAHDLAVSAVPFLYGFVAAVVIGVPLGIVMGWRGRLGYGLGPPVAGWVCNPPVALVGEFFAASEGIGYAISKFGDIFALDRMFACIITVMAIAVVLTEGIRWAERAAFPWRSGR